MFARTPCPNKRACVSHALTSSPTRRVEAPPTGSSRRQRTRLGEFLNRSAAVLFGVTSFWQGVDVRGQGLMIGVEFVKDRCALVARHLGQGPRPTS